MGNGLFANPKSHNEDKIVIVFICRKANLRTVTVELYYCVLFNDH